MTVDIKVVLAMSEEEQYGWVCAKLCNKRDYKTICDLSSCKLSLADLAFQLRDEAVEKDAFEWMKACESIFEIACPKSQWSNYDIWWQDYSQPIHWILTAMLAKEMSR